MLIKTFPHSHSPIVVGVIDVTAEEKILRLWLQLNQR
jgi:hypothetical protein